MTPVGANLISADLPKDLMTDTGHVAGLFDFPARRGPHSSRELGAPAARARYSVASVPGSSILSRNFPVSVTVSTTVCRPRDSCCPMVSVLRPVFFLRAAGLAFFVTLALAFALDFLPRFAGDFFRAFLAIKPPM